MTPNNLAVLCIECHHKTQIHGGFAKMLTAGMVRRHRDEWLRMVKEKKRALAGQVAVDVPRTMTPEQALRHAKYLRDLYVPFYDAVRIMKHVATQVSQPWGSETWDERGQRLSRELDEALETIGAMLPVLRVEPGSIYVCKEFDLFYLNWTRYVEGLNKQYEYALAKFKDPDHSIGFFRRLGTDNWRDSMNEHARGLQQAIQNHIQSFDNLT